MIFLGWALICYGQYSYKKRKFENRDKIHIERKWYEETHKEGYDLQVKETDLEQILLLRSQKEPTLLIR